MPSATLPAATILGAAHLIVADLDRSVRFYTETLGFVTYEIKGDTVYLTAGGTGPSGDETPWLRLTALPGARPKPRRSTGLYHIAILTPDRHALAQALRRIAEARYPMQGASDHLVSEALYLADPDGNGLEIYWDRPRADWPLVDGKLAMDSQPLDLERLLMEGMSDSITQARLEPATRLGHVHLHVADLDAAVNFYAGVLGFDIMARLGNSAAFLSAGGYHHHIGLNTWAGVGAPPPPADAAGLRGFEIILPTRTDLDQVLARVQAADIGIADHDQMAEVRDPTGNAVWLRAA